MAGTIDFFYEFASPYSFLAAQRLPALATQVGRIVRWRPIELGKVWAAQDVLEAYGAIRKIKRGYIIADAQRTAEDLGISMKVPRGPTDATLARLAVYGLEARTPGQGAELSLKLWHRLWGEGLGISSIEDLMAVAPGGVDQPTLIAATQLPASAAHLESANADAITLSCFGVPWIVADGDSYFGQDQLDMLERRLKRP